jgi:hypothetical protein
MARSDILTSAIESRSSCVRLTLTEASLIFNLYERASWGFFIASPPRRANLGNR